MKTTTLPLEIYIQSYPFIPVSPNELLVQDYYRKNPLSLQYGGVKVAVSYLFSSFRYDKVKDPILYLHKMFVNWLKDGFSPQDLEQIPIIWEGAFSRKVQAKDILNCILGRGVA